METGLHLNDEQNIFVSAVYKHLPQRLNFYPSSASQLNYRTLIGTGQRL